MPDIKDKDILRGLAAEAAEIAALPVQEGKKALWRRMNSLRPERPMVMIDQVCWNEMEVDGELELKCEDAECRGYELMLRRMLFQWRHFPVDMVVEPHIGVPKAISNTGFGVSISEQTAVSDPTSSVVGHKYENQFKTEEDLDKIQIPRITHDESETERRLDIAHDLFDGLLEVKAAGMSPYLSLWDPIAMWMGVEEALYALIDRPDYMHRLLERMTEGYLGLLDQLEEKGLLCEPQATIHCSGAFTDELPADGYDPDRPRTRDIWMFSMAQMFSTVSPRHFKEFEIDYTARLCERFGLVYYGCCEPLDDKMDEVRELPNVRKVSMSPWVDVERGAAEIGSEFVFSRKPSPAYLAWDIFSAGDVRKDLAGVMRTCEKHGRPLEFILKDISTVRYQPQRLFDWARIAMEVVCG